MKKSAMIIINPTAGKEKAVTYEGEIRHALEKDYPNLIVKHTQGEGDATRFAKSAGEKNFDLVVSLGGDGTVNETVNGLAGFENPPVLGIVPMGTVNDLARALNIPIPAEQSIKFLTNGVHKKIDVGVANNRYFTNILGVGNAAKAIHNVEIEAKSNLGPLAYAIAVAKEILEDDVFPVKLQMDDETWEGNVSVVLIGLIDSLGGLKSILPDVEVGDGKFYILAIKRLNVTELMKMTPSLFLGKITKSKNVEYFRSKNLKIEALDKNKRESDVDGERGPELPLELKVLTRHLSVISKQVE